MDSRLWLLYEQEADDEIEAIIRLRRPGVTPDGVRVVAQMGDIITVRLPRRQILNVRRDPAVASMKASAPVRPSELWPASRKGSGHSDERRPNVAETGAGVVVGVVDFGIDPAHPAFMRRGSELDSRISKIWDQRPAANTRSPQPYGYGVVHTNADINRALRQGDPYRALGYRPGQGPGGAGEHGCHVADIAAGSGLAGPSGIAPDADILFVHLSSARGESLGSDIHLAEAIAWLLEGAGARPIAVNCSIGRSGGSHLGASPLERFIDNALTAVPGRAICQSVGNYRSAAGHAYRQVRAGETWSVRWNVRDRDPTTNEVELWVPPGDSIRVAVRAPGNRSRTVIPINSRSDIVVDGQKVGRVLSRSGEPNTRKSHWDIYLHPNAPGGQWRIDLSAGDIVDGRCHLWIERDQPGRASSFDPRDVAEESTTGTICNGYKSISTGALDGRREEQPLAAFSSIGPTADGRRKPDVVAPGVAVLAARSEPGPTRPLTTRHSGTSMASPQTAGTVALMFEAAARPIHIEETRYLLFSAADRNGDGTPRLNPAAAVKAARSLSARDRGEDGGTEPPSETRATQATPDPEHLLAPTTPGSGERCIERGEST